MSHETDTTASLLGTWKTRTRSLFAQDALPVRFQRVVLALILLGCCVVRVLTIDAPAIDRTDWKEIDHLMISGNYWTHGFHFLYPEIDWPAQPPRYTAMEFPLVPYLAALSYSVFGFHAFSARLVTLIAFVVASLYTFRLARRECGPVVGLVAALTAAALPLHHPFGKFLFSEPWVIACSVMCLFHYAEWADSRRKLDFVVALIAFSLSIALKLTPLYLLLPLTWIAVRRDGVTLPALKRVGVFTLGALVLPVAWYAWAYHLSVTYVDVFGVFGGRFGGHDKFQTLSMLSDPTWYRVMAGRLTWDILGGRPLLWLAFFGMFVSVLFRCAGLPLAYLAAIACFFGLVAEGQLDTPYRQLPVVPPISIMVALGLVGVAAIPPSIRAWWLSRTEILPTSQRRHVLAAVLALLTVLCVSATHYREIVPQDPAIPVGKEKWDLAKRVRQLAGPEAKIVTLGEYTIHKGGNDLSPVLYYFSGLQGWSLQKEDCRPEVVSKLIDRGATHFVGLRLSREPETRPFVEILKSQYPVLYETSDALLLELKPHNEQQVVSTSSPH